MSAYIARALHALKSGGFRITRPRQLVLSVLDQSRVPMSAYDIKAQLDEMNERVDTVSVYRILDCLAGHGLVHALGGDIQVTSTPRTGEKPDKNASGGRGPGAITFQKCQIGDEASCHHQQADHCHHFLRCERCHGVTEVHCPEGLGVLIRQMALESNFSASRHGIEVYGTCSACLASL
ncbi:MAG: transcriptional repressor [Vampirovibrionales bacterium]|nr:transcriptional repressor [Vampirovibrionales bacterium]